MENFQELGKIYKEKGTSKIRYRESFKSVHLICNKKSMINSIQFRLYYVDTQLLTEVSI